MNRTRIYTKLSEDELQIFDTTAKHLGYPNRTEFITSLMQAVVHDQPLDHCAEKVNDIIQAHDELRQLKQTFMGVIEEYAFPVIAMKGADAAYKALADDLPRWMYEKCQTVPLESDMKEWIKSYYAANQGSIRRYRINQTTERYAEEHGEQP